MAAGPAQRRVEAIVGQPLCLTRRALDLRIFHFGRLRVEGKRTYGQWALHIACPWRIDGPGGLLTGSGDARHLATPGRTGVPPDRAADITEITVQDVALGAMLGVYPEKLAAMMAPPDAFVVSDLAIGAGFALTLTFAPGRERLTVMPDGTQDESWRFFSLDSDDPHLVILGDRIEEDDDDEVRPAW